MGPPPASPVLISEPAAGQRQGSRDPLAPKPSLCFAGEAKVEAWPTELCLRVDLRLLKIEQVRNQGGSRQAPLPPPGSTSGLDSQRETSSLEERGTQRTGDSGAPGLPGRNQSSQPLARVSGKETKAQVWGI